MGKNPWDLVVVTAKKLTGRFVAANVQDIIGPDGFTFRGFFVSMHNLGQTQHKHLVVCVFKQARSSGSMGPETELAPSIGQSFSVAFAIAKGFSPISQPFSVRPSGLGFLISRAFLI